MSITLWVFMVEMKRNHHIYDISNFLFTYVSMILSWGPPPPHTHVYAHTPTCGEKDTREKEKQTDIQTGRERQTDG